MGKFGDAGYDGLSSLAATDSTVFKTAAGTREATVTDIAAAAGGAFTAANTGTSYTATRTSVSEDFLLTNTGNSTITLAGGGVSGKVSVWNIIFKQDATGGRSTTVSGVVWVGGTPTFVTTANASNHCTFVQYGTGTIYGYYGGSATS